MRPAPGLFYTLSGGLALLGTLQALSVVKDTQAPYLSFLTAAVVLILPTLRELTLEGAGVKVALKRAEEAEQRASEAQQEAEVAKDLALEMHRTGSQPVGGGVAQANLKAGASLGALGATQSAASVSDPNKDDPNKGGYGGTPISGERELSATYSPLDKRNDYVRVNLKVESRNPARNPLVGTVTFYLHPTFHEPVRHVRVRNGVAQLSTVSWGAFTVGAVCPDGTRLELDLAKDSAAPAGWRSR